MSHLVLKEPSPQLLSVAWVWRESSGWKRRIGAVEGGSAVWVLGIERERERERERGLEPVVRGGGGKAGTGGVDFGYGEREREREREKKRIQSWVIERERWDERE
jgi:hypothetical protein